MEQQDISRETVARLRAERETVSDPAYAAALDDQIRLHAALAGPEADAEAPQAKAAMKASKAAKPAEV